MSKIWYQTYRPIIVSGEHNEEYFKKMSFEEFKKIFIEAEALPIPLHIILAEFYWIKSEKPVYFVEQGIVDFIVKSKANLSTTEVSPKRPVSISWHPQDKLPSCLVYPVTAATMIHVSDCDGTWSIIMPHHNIPDDTKLTPEMVRLRDTVFGLLTYMQAFPDHISPGLPEDMKARNARFLSKYHGCVVQYNKELVAGGYWELNEGRIEYVNDK